AFDCICACVDPIRKTAGCPFMTDSSSAGFSWVCPACDRRVPRKLTECRCGYTPDWTDAPPDVAAHDESPSSAGSSAAGIIASVVLALTAIVVGAWYMNRPSARPAPVPESASVAANTSPAPVHPPLSHSAPATEASQTPPIEPQPVEHVAVVAPAAAG